MSRAPERFRSREQRACPAPARPLAATKKQRRHCGPKIAFISPKPAVFPLSSHPHPEARSVPRSRQDLRKKSGVRAGENRGAANGVGGPSGRVPAAQCAASLSSRRIGGLEPVPHRRRHAEGHEGVTGILPEPRRCRKSPVQERAEPEAWGRNGVSLRPAGPPGTPGGSGGVAQACAVLRGLGDSSLWHHHRDSPTKKRSGTPKQPAGHNFPS